MKANFLLAIAAGLILAGCSDSNSNNTPSAATNNLTTNDAKLGNDYLSTLAKSDKSMVKTIDTTSLNNEINQFQVSEGRYPKDLDELVEKKYIGKIPDAPYGYKLDYNADNGTVTVVPQ